VILAYVIMPNHVHLVLKTTGQHSISKCIGNLKRITSRQLTDLFQRIKKIDLIEKLQEAASQESDKSCRVWKSRFDCLVLYSLDMLRQKIGYIHTNPIRACLVENQCDWKYSSASDYAGQSLGILIVDSSWSSLGYD
jgi:REP element-mobilizing transposase RayT